jgi:hypothetical protein
MQVRCRLWLEELDDWGWLMLMAVRGPMARRESARDVGDVSLAYERWDEEGRLGCDEGCGLWESRVVVTISCSELWDL